MEIQITRSYFAKRGFIDTADENGTIRVIEFGCSELDSILYRAISNEVKLNYNSETIVLSYTWEEKKGVLWVTCGQKIPLTSKGSQNEFVLLSDGSVVDYETSHNEDGTFKEGYDTSYNQVLISLGLRDSLSPLMDSFLKMNLLTKVLPLYVE